MTTKLCPAVFKCINGCGNKFSYSREILNLTTYSQSGEGCGMNDQSIFCPECLSKIEGAVAQAEWERERVKKAIDELPHYEFAYDSLVSSDDGWLIDFKELLKMLDIEQEEKEK
jgi:hypothetical protein